jgi:hypothetical protein
MRVSGRHQPTEVTENDFVDKFLLFVISLCKQSSCDDLFDQLSFEGDIWSFSLFPDQEIVNLGSRILVRDNV